MSRQVALDNINLKPTTRWGHTEYSLDYHHEYLERKTGLPRKDPNFGRKVHEKFAFDFLWSTNDGLTDWDKMRRRASVVRKPNAWIWR